MAFGSRKATLTLAGHTVTVDAQDADRVSIHEWKATRLDQNQIAFYREAGTPGNQYFQLLSAFIFDAAPGVFVELIDSNGASMLDYRRKNLRVSPRSAIKPKAKRAE